MVEIVRLQIVGYGLNDARPLGGVDFERRTDGNADGAVLGLSWGEHLGLRARPRKSQTHLALSHQAAAMRRD